VWPLDDGLEPLLRQDLGHSHQSKLTRHSFIRRGLLLEGGTRLVQRVLLVDVSAGRGAQALSG
jgi:hypothetical protein